MSACARPVFVLFYLRTSGLGLRDKWRAAVRSPESVDVAGKSRPAFCVTDSKAGRDAAGLTALLSFGEGLKDMLKMIASQWKELQRQIKRQHSWILKALDTIKAEILATDVSAEDEEGTGSPKVSGLKFALLPLIPVFF